ncbi:MAG: winged helix-turn-helix transcriptional regulator [Prevotella sp.]
MYKIILLNPHSTITQMAAQLKLSDRQIRKYIKRLTDMNLIVREGGRKTGVWQIIDKDYDSFFEPQ